MKPLSAPLPPTIRTPSPTLIWHWSVSFQNWGVPCNYRVREEETKRQIFGSMCRVSRLLLLVIWWFVVVCGCLLLVCFSFVGGLQSFVVVCGCFCPLPVLVTTLPSSVSAIYIIALFTRHFLLYSNVQN